MLSVGIVGAGAMGSAIASYFARDWDVAIVDSSSASLDASRLAVRGLVRTWSGDPAAEAEHVRWSRDLAAVAAADLVVEAVPESLELKRSVLRAVSDLVGTDAVVATNTSSLPIGELAATMRMPERFLGIHFFNPRLSVELVEVVTHAGVDPVVVDTALEWVRALGKTPIRLAESPGFVTSRLANALSLEAMRVYEEGVASAEDIDRAMTIGYRHEVGPLRLSDLVGLDVRLAIARELETKIGPRFAPPRALIDLVEAGHLGVKSGRGFFEWPDAAT